ncbi:hypothetical protein CERZMDRAFT_46415 [Cercospora zeae-maydis SCOH1-5]|uniref:Uncharacterized protein n=1 Tax=Cercospora zeae-maydis SCOH1-5 TaxID=717836 RepID=A0A6A6F9C6_9PEZI|nr:hypothetical protein CERZMDRAFT_46415 [Cercospora zeae-maydis SCOH1-5]
MGSIKETSLFYQSVQQSGLPFVAGASGIYYTLSNGRKIIDSTCGAAVASIGHGDPRVKEAIISQLDKVSYAHPGYFQNDPSHDLADELVASTKGHMARACLTGSGSEAMEIAVKLARTYHLSMSPKSPRVHFIAREGSWHGCTLGTLSLGDFKGRKAPFQELLMDNVSRVSACHPYRGLRQGESEEEYLLRLQAELEAEFQRVGPHKVAAFVVEPIVGTTLGCVAPVQGYFEAMKEVCDRHGALIIFDEIMCGLGRVGTFHAWEQLGIVPDIQAVGKGLGAGYSTISAVLFNDKVVAGLEQGSGYFEHGQTYQCHPVACAGALEVQRIIRGEKLVQNVAVLGDYLGKRLRARFHGNQHVGDVRGRGFFWCVEIVKDASSKEAFDPALQIAKRMRLKGLQRGYDICLFSAGGSVDGHKGDHFLLMPPFIVRQDEVDEIVERVGNVVDSVMMEVASGVTGPKIAGLSNSA